MTRVSGKCPNCGQKLVDCTCSARTIKNRAVPKGTTTSPPKLLTDAERNPVPVKDESPSAATITEPMIGLRGKRSGHPADRSDWDEIEDPEQYTLPPVDRNLYDIYNSQSSKDKIIEPSSSHVPVVKKTKSQPKEVVLSEEKSEIPTEYHDTPDEDLYRRKGCWCKDCPWLIAYLISAILWLLFMAIIVQTTKFTGSHFPVEDSECVLRCSQLKPPFWSLDLPKATPRNFHCRSSADRKWEKDIFHPYYVKIDPHSNPNCVEDCKSFQNWAAFKWACINPIGTNDWRQDTKYLPKESKGIVYVDSVRSHWYWIIHVILITNAISLFVLLVSIFFCCPMVGIFAVAGVIAAIAITIRLWLEFYGQNRNIFENESSSRFLTLALTIALTTFSIYVVVNSVIVFMRFRLTCAIAAMASRVVNAVSMILLETLLTILLLFIWIAILIVVTLAIEGTTAIYLSGDQFYHYSPPFTWIARIYTLFFAYWTAQLLINCQTIIIHGAMARYYFEKNTKNRVLKSHKRLLKYHICTACFAGLLFNWLYWVRLIKKQTPIRSRSLFGTGTFGLCFCPASRIVGNLIFDEPAVWKSIDKANPYFFIVHMTIVILVALVCRLVFSAPYSNAHWPDFLMIFYAYFVGMAVIDTYRVTKDAMFLCYSEDKLLTREQPDRNMKMPEPVSVFFGHEARVSPR